MKSSFNKLRYRIEYMDLKYPYLKFIPLAIIIASLFIGKEDIINSIFKVIAFFITIVLHEVSHGAVAYFFGDETAKKAGRLTLNPFKHIDLQGLLLPAILLILKSPIIIGSAKPVPTNEYYFKPRKLGIFCVSFAGVLTNFLIAFIAGILIRFIDIYYIKLFLFNLFMVNVSLGVFNLVPIPPLDGSRILRLIVPNDFKHILDKIESNPMVSFFLIIVLLQTNVLEKVYVFMVELLWML